MTKFLFILLAFTFGSNDLARVNSLKKEAAEAYQNENYELAVEKYNFLVDSMEIMDDQILLNLANAYVHLNDSSNAKSTYNRVVPTSDKKAKSVAYQQLGVLNDQPENLEVALNYFKEALKADPTNKDARYNYEVVKKKLRKQQEEQEKQDQNQDQNQENQDQEDKEQEQKENQDQKQDGENEDQQEGNQDEEKQNQKEDGEQQDSEQKEGENQEGEQQEGEENEGEEKKEGEQKEGEEQEGEQKDGEQSEQDQDGEKSEEQKLKELKEKLKELNISPEKANNIFESYGNKEIQYLHQLKKRNTKPRDKTKPDW